MARKKLVLFLHQPQNEPNVRITNETDADRVLLEITPSGSNYSDLLELEPNADRDIYLDTGSYWFAFSFQKLSGPSSLTVQVRTPHANSPFPPSPKTRTEPNAGQTGLVSFRVRV